MYSRWQVLLAGGLLSALTGCFIFGIRVDSSGPADAGGSDEPKPVRRELRCDLGDLPPANPEERLPLAVLDFQFGESMEADVGRALADLCRDAIQRTNRFVLVDRQRVAEVLGERDFAQALKCDNAVCLARYGRLLGAQKVVHGRISRLGGVLVLSVNMTDVETSAQISESASLASIEDSTGAVPKLVCQVLRSAFAEDQRDAATPQRSLTDPD